MYVVENLFIGLILVLVIIVWYVLLLVQSSIEKSDFVHCISSMVEMFCICHMVGR